jgi:hypothetical protein
LVETAVRVIAFDVTYDPGSGRYNALLLKSACYGDTNSMSLA